jgi:hypothetical protein
MVLSVALSRRIAPGEAGLPGQRFHGDFNDWDCRVFLRGLRGFMVNRSFDTASDVGKKRTQAVDARSTFLQSIDPRESACP